MTEKLRTLLDALAAYPGCNNPATWSVIDGTGELYEDLIAAGAETRSRYYDPDDYPEDCHADPYVIDSATLVVGNVRLHTQLDARSPSPNERREHEQAQQAMAVLGKDIAEA